MTYFMTINWTKTLATCGLCLGLLSIGGLSSSASAKRISPVKSQLVTEKVQMRPVQVQRAHNHIKHIQVHLNHSIKNKRTQTMAKAQPNNINNKNIDNDKNKQVNNNFQHVNKIAKSKLGDRYSYGAVGPHKFDCSGFTRYVYQKGMHITLPRTAEAQYHSGKKITKNKRQAGDLVFFGSNVHNIYHVGIYIGKGNMIDAQNRGVVTEKVNAPWWHAVGYSRPFIK